jgi:hypothetical protein
MQIHTRTLTSGNSLVITSSMGVYGFSFNVETSSSGTLLGDVTINGVASNAVTLASGGATISANTPTSPLSGITLSCTSGTIDVILTVFI